MPMYRAQQNNRQLARGGFGVTPNPRVRGNHLLPIVIAHLVSNFLGTHPLFLTTNLNIYFWVCL
jgi:hypothetical protein